MASDSSSCNCEDDKKSKFLLYLSLFFILIGVIILCSYNAATYSDIRNGNTNAPDISNTTATAMIVINAIFIVVSSVSLLGVIYAAYKGALDTTIPDIDGIIKTTNSDGEEVYSYADYGRNYRPNRPRTQLWLWVFSTGIFVMSLFNVIQYMKIAEGPDTTAVNVGGFYVFFTWFIFAVALVYWLYTSIRTFYPRKYQAKLLYRLNLFKPSIESSGKADTSKSAMKDFCKTAMDAKAVAERLNSTAKSRAASKKGGCDSFKSIDKTDATTTTVV